MNLEQKYWIPAPPDDTINFLYSQGFFSPYPEIQNDLIERIFPLYKVVLLLLILFLGLPQIAFTGYSGMPRDMFIIRTRRVLRCS